MDGTITSINFSSHVITLLVSGGNSANVQVGTYTPSGVNNYEKLSVMVYKIWYTDPDTQLTAQYKVGIELNSIGENNGAVIDVYSGRHANTTIRTGNIYGLSYTGINGSPTTITAENSWGFYAKGNAYIEGHIVASSGRFANWSIADNMYYNDAIPGANSITLSPNGKFSTATIGGSPVDLTWAFTVKDYFGVTTAGAMYAKSGKIGGWTIGSSALSTGNYGDTNSIYLSNTTMASKSIANVTSDEWVFTIDSHFGVTNAGKLCCDTVELTGSIAATSGSVGGWGIANNAIYSTTTDSTGLETTVALQNSILNITTTNCIVSADGNSITATALENGSISFSSAVLPISSGAGTYTVELTITRPKDVQGDFSYSFNTASGSSAGVVVIPEVIGSGSGMVITTDSFSSNSSITPTSITVGASLTNCRKDDQMIVQFVIKKGSTVVPIGWDYGDNTKLPSNIIIGVTKKDSSDNLSIPFYITNSGKMYCENVEAVGGTIGGWTIGANALSTGTYGSDNSVFLSTANMASKAIGGRTGADWRFTIGSHFGVTNTGAIYSNSGTIGGWKIDSTGLSLDNSSLDTKLTTGELKISDTNTNGWFAVSITGTGIQLLSGPSKANVSPFVKIEHDRLQIDAATYKSCGIYAHPVSGNYYGLYDFGRSRWMLFANESESDAILYTQSSISASKSTGDIAFSVSNDTRRGRLLVNSSGVLGLYDATNSSWMIRSDTNQKVYIPHNLSVTGTVETTGNITVTKTSGDTSIGATNGTRNGKLLINSSGVFGLYDSTNSKWLIQSATDQSVSVPHNFSITGTLNVSSTIDSSNITITTASSVAARLGVKCTNVREGRFQINTNGDFGIYDVTNSGWVIKSDSSQNIEISKPTNVTAMFKCVNYTSDARPVVQSTNSKGYRILRQYTTGTTLGIYGEWNSSTDYDFTARTISVPSSDIRLKENVENCQVNALSVLNQIKVRQFDWKDANIGHQKIGFIADEMEKIDSKFAIGGGYDQEGIMNTKSVDTFYLQGYEVKAIQELHQLIKDQATEIQELKAKIKELKGM